MARKLFSTVASTAVLLLACGAPVPSISPSHSVPTAQAATLSITAAYDPSAAPLALGASALVELTPSSSSAAEPLPTTLAINQQAPVTEQLQPGQYLLRGFIVLSSPLGTSTSPQECSLTLTLAAGADEAVLMTYGSATCTLKVN